MWAWQFWAVKGPYSGRGKQFVLQIDKNLQEK